RLVGANGLISAYTGCTSVSHASAVGPLTTRPREDGTLFQQDRWPFLPSYFANNVLPSSPFCPIDITSRPGKGEKNRDSFSGVCCSASVGISPSTTHHSLPRRRIVSFHTR
ncbi:unnamed protein product, partial [Ectocarpus sp. 12 AP-2014]